MKIDWDRWTCLSFGVFHSTVWKPSSFQCLCHSKCKARRAPAELVFSHRQEHRGTMFGHHGAKKSCSKFRTHRFVWLEMMGDDWYMIGLLLGSSCWIPTKGRSSKNRSENDVCKAFYIHAVLWVNSHVFSWRCSSEGYVPSSILSIFMCQMISCQIYPMKNPTNIYKYDMLVGDS